MGVNTGEVYTGEGGNTEMGVYLGLGVYTAVKAYMREGKYMQGRAHIKGHTWSRRVNKTGSVTGEGIYGFGCVHGIGLSHEHWCIFKRACIHKGGKYI